MVYIKDNIPRKQRAAYLFFTYFSILAISNVLKQAFYQPEMKQLNDYILGIGATLWLAINLIKLWAIQNKQSGMR